MSKVQAYRRFHPGTQPEYDFPFYASTAKRHPTQPLVIVPQTLSEITGPVFGWDDLKPTDNDLTRQHKSDPLGERIIVSCRVLDENGRPMPHTLVEVWQANAAGRYPHKNDTHNAPVDPNFSGAGRTLTDAEGRYRFVTIRPGYPWRNHYNAWRPAHIHFSLFGPAFATRLVTQMYCPRDPLLPYDPMFMCVPDERARNRLVSKLDWEPTVPEWALGYRFSLMLVTALNPQIGYDNAAKVAKEGTRRK